MRSSSKKAGHALRSSHCIATRLTIRGYWVASATGTTSFPPEVPMVPTGLPASCAGGFEMNNAAGVLGFPQFQEGQ